MGMALDTRTNTMAGKDGPPCTGVSRATQQNLTLELGTDMARAFRLPGEPLSLRERGWGEGRAERAARVSPRGYSLRWRLVGLAAFG